MRRWNWLAAIILTLTGVSFAGCGGSGPTTDDEAASQTMRHTDVMPGTEPAGSEAAIREQKLKFVDAAQKEIDNIKIQLDHLEMQSNERGPEVHKPFEEAKSVVERQLKDAQNQLDQIKQAGVKSWKQYKDNFNNSLEQLQAAFSNAMTIVEPKG